MGKGLDEFNKKIGRGMGVGVTTVIDSLWKIFTKFCAYLFDFKARDKEETFFQKNTLRIALWSLLIGISGSAIFASSTPTHKALSTPNEEVLFSKRNQPTILDRIFHTKSKYGSYPEITLFIGDAFMQTPSEGECAVIRNTIRNVIVMHLRIKSLEGYSMFDTVQVLQTEPTRRWVTTTWGEIISKTANIKGELPLMLLLKIDAKPEVPSPPKLVCY